MKREYEAPSITSYSLAQILERVGPALSSYPCVTVT